MTVTLTPAQVAERIGFSERFVRDLAKTRKVECLVGGKGSIRFTEEQYAALVAHLTQPVTPAADSLTTARSRRRAS